MSYRPAKLISGGQSGSDIGALVAARRLGIPTGGWAPRGFLTEKGRQPVLAEYGLIEAESEQYPQRTEWNVRDSDATLIFSRNPKSRGTLQTMQCAMRLKKSFSQPIDPRGPDALEQVCEFLDKHRPAVLNVAGNRESVAPGIALEVVNLLVAVFAAMASRDTDRAATGW